MENATVVNETPLTPEIQEEPVIEGAGEPVKAGDKTEPNLLLKSLKEEREKRRELEERLQQLEEQVNPSVPSEPENEDISSLKAELAEVKSKQQRSEILESYPMLKELWPDFEEFRTETDNKGMNMRTAAKAFLVEKGLLEPQRKGLEKPTGGPRTPISSGMSNEDVTNLRTTNYKKYLEMVRKGQIKITQ